MKPERPKQETPGDLVNDLMLAIRNQFYGDCLERWHADQHFIRRNVVTWPAGWLNKRGVTLPPKRYRDILFSILNGVKVHGNTGAVRFWPGYLMKCVQEHFAVHGEEYYQEGKSIRAKADIAMFAVSRAKEAAHRADPVQGVAIAHAVLQAAHTRKRKACKPPQQRDLFEL
jgi:hypothetical protein